MRSSSNWHQAAPYRGLGRVLAIRVRAEDPLVPRQRPLVLGRLVVQFPNQQLGLRRLRLIGIVRDQLLKGRLRGRLLAPRLEAVPLVEQGRGLQPPARGHLQDRAKCLLRGLVIALAQGHATQLKMEFSRLLWGRCPRQPLFQDRPRRSQAVLGHQRPAHQ